jgi:hypothetical protein
VGSALVAGLEDVVDGIRQACRDRETRTQALRERGDVRPHAQGAVEEDLAATPESGLDLVRDQQRTRPIARFPCGAGELHRGRHHTPFPLHGLEEHGAGAFVDGLDQSLWIVERNMDESRH